MKQDDIYFDGLYYFRLSYNTPTDEWVLYACEVGYVKDVVEFIKQCEMVGTFNDFKDKFNCD